ALNRERAQGTLIKLIAQPVYRDAVINGKFLAGVTTITIMLVSIVLVTSGFGLTLLGIVPGVEEVLRLTLYVVLSIFYISFWLGIAILFSIIFRSIPTSALASVALWIFLSFFVSLGADVLAGTIAPVDQRRGADREAMLRNAHIKENISLFSPMTLYSKASATLVDPMRNTTRSMVLMGRMESISASRFERPLPLGQSVLVVYPHLVALVGITLVCFGVSYLVFMAQEIRN
ncbi:MAG: ABC transporter permease, partial [Desulfobacteraceae bacterium]